VDGPSIPPGTTLGDRCPHHAALSLPYHLTISPVLVDRTSTNSRSISIIS
jgi:hypothetical protein